MIIMNIIMKTIATAITIAVMSGLVILMFC